MFDLYLTGERAEAFMNGPTPEALYGRIQLNEHIETFVASLAYWSRDAYEQHWVRALQSIVEAEDRAALITSYFEPSENETLTWWVLYRDGETVHVQNQLVIFDQLTEPFSAEAPWKSIPQRATMNDEGLPISEWHVTLFDIRNCLDRRYRQG